MGFLILLLLAVALMIFYIRTSRHPGIIEEKVTSINGVLLNYERRNFFTGIGPFMFVGKNNMIYRFEYEVNGVKKEGWVKFRGLFGPDWRL